MSRKQRIEDKLTSKQDEQNRAIEAAYRRGYHHGYALGMDLIFGLLERALEYYYFVSKVIYCTV